MAGSADTFPGQFGRLGAFLWLLPVLLAGVLYVNTLEHGFVFDDTGVILLNPNIHSPTGIAGLFGLRGSPPSLRPITRATYVLDYALSWGGPLSFHLTNLLLHMLVTGVVYALVREVTKSPKMGLLAALLFASHPVHTGAVAYIQGRRDVLMSVFYLPACLLFARYHRSRQRWWIVCVCVLFVLAFFAKEMAVTLPAALLAYDVSRRADESSMCKGGWRRWGYALKESLDRSAYLYAPLTILALAFVYYATSIRPPQHLGVLYGGGVFVHIEYASRILLTHLRLLVFPLKLLADYSPNTIPVFTSAFNGFGILSLAGALVFLGGMLTFSWHRPGVGFWLLWILLTLLPVLQIVPHPEPLAEHYLYLPSVGFCALVALGFDKLAKVAKLRTWAYGLVLLLVAGYSLRTVIRNSVWQSELTLWRDTVKQAPDNARAHYNLARVCKKSGLRVPAVTHYSKAIDILPDWPHPYYELARIYFEDEGIEDVIELLKSAQRLADPNFRVDLLLCWCYLIMGQRDSAVAIYPRLPREALREPWASPTTRMYRALSRALELSPFDVEGHLKLSCELLAEGLWVEAKCLLMRARALAPDNLDVRLTLAVIYLDHLQDIRRCQKEIGVVLQHQPLNTRARALKDRLAFVKAQPTQDLSLNGRTHP